jgi:ABC-2 type transport system ATP-binding protein
VPAITIKNVAKKFKVYYDRAASLKERILFKNRSSYEDRWVLKDVSFEVAKGEAVGIIGQNGCGKSTMLKLMTQIMYPNKGSIEIQGRISSLIELGAGFHPDMSGRENIYTNASIFGLTRKEIDRRVEEIIDFSEIREFIDNPVRTYSSGMYARLAFSVAIHVDADVLIVDEILAVGDASFQSKCFNKMREIKASGVTIVIVSHGLGQIEQLCERSIWIEEGLVRAIGTPRDVHPEYLFFMGQKSRASDEQTSQSLDEEPQATDELQSEPPPSDSNRWGNHDIKFTSVMLTDESGNQKDAFETGESMNIEIKYKVNKPIENPVFGMAIFRNDDVLCYGTNTHVDRIDISEMNQNGVVKFQAENNNLLAGEYSLDVAVVDKNDFSFMYDYIKGVLKFNMFTVDGETGVSRIDHSWYIG